MTKERLTLLAASLGLSVSKLSISIGKSEGYIRTMSGFAGSDVISDILRLYPEVNAYWLILGQGDVFRSAGTVVGDNNNISGSNIGNGSVDNSINIQAPPEGYEKIIKPDRTVIVQRAGLAENSQQIADLQDIIDAMQATIDSQKETIKAQNVTIELLREKNK